MLTTFATGEELIKALTKLPAYQYPNLIITDLNLPGLNGIELAQQVRNNSRLKMLPIILLTASDRQGDVYKAYHNGINAFIHKPPTYPELKMLVKNLSLYWMQIGQLPYHF